jgi:hypothetical protein
LGLSLPGTAGSFLAAFSENDDDAGDLVGHHALEPEADAGADGAREYKQEAEVHPQRVEGDQETQPEEGRPDDGMEGIAGTLFDPEGRIDLVAQIGLQQRESGGEIPFRERVNARADFLIDSFYRFGIPVEHQ